MTNLKEKKKLLTNLKEKYYLRIIKLTKEKPKNILIS